MTTTRNVGASDSPKSTPPQAYPAEKARQGEIVLKTKWSRIVFFGGLIGGLILAFAVAILLGIFG